MCEKCHIFDKKQEEIEDRRADLQFLISREKFLNDNSTYGQYTPNKLNKKGDRTINNKNGDRTNKGRNI